MNVAKRIAELRAGAKLSQNALAKKAGIGQATIREIEIGEKSPNILTLEKICVALDISLAEFFTDEDPSKDAAHHLYGECGDLPKEAVERVAELIALYRIKYKVEKDSQK